jgi:RND family efflux transporter MFP subunit
VRLQSENAKAKYERGRKLHEQKPPLISDQDFADLETAYEVAKSNYDVELLTAQSLVADARALQSELEQALQQVADTTIRAPGRAPETQSLQTQNPQTQNLQTQNTQTQIPVAVAASAEEESTTRASETGDAGQPAAQPAANADKPPGSATRPTKPIRYAVASRLTSIGEYVREGTPLFRLVADDPIKFRAQVAERFLGQVKVGQAVRVKVEAYPEPFEGVVSRISPQVELATRSFQVEMLLPNEEGKLQPGSFAEGAILTRIDPEVTLVPAEALVTFAGVTKVFTVDEQRKAVEKKVELGQAVGDAVEVVSGLEGVMPLVTQGRGKLAPGTPVVPSAAAAAPATQAVTGAQTSAE